MKPTMCAWFVRHVSTTRCVDRAAVGAERGRRAWLKRGGLAAAALGCGWLNSSQAAETLSFNARSVDASLQALGAIPASAGQISLTVPDVSENGAFVPVSVVCSLAGAQEIAIVVETNPDPLAARFDIPEGTEALVSTRVKISESGRVYAVVKADGKYYSSFRHATVMVGGCG
jgi:sulfur-oxidizing protein SoxY